MKKYEINEDDLLYLIECRARLEALESGGVDNWSWYSDAYGDYLYDMKEQYGMDPDSEDLDFCDVAMHEIQHYKEVQNNAK